MSKHGLQARPIHHSTRGSIEALPGVVFAAMAISHWIGTKPVGASTNSSARVRRYRTVTIQAGNHTLTGAEPRQPTSPTSTRPLHTSLIKVGDE